MTAVPNGQEVDDVQRRIEAVQAEISDAEAPPALVQVIVDASVLLEELHVANEEIRSQNEQLALMHEVLEAERARYQRLFDPAPDGYLVTDEDAVISEANRTAAAMVAVKPEWLAGKPLLVFVARESHDAFLGCVSRLRAGKESESIELLITPREGDPFPAEVIVVATHEMPIDATMWRWLVRDIRQRKAQEAAKRANDEHIAVLKTQAEAAALEAMVTERERIGRDLHDGVSQVLGYMRFRLQSVSDLLDQGDIGQARQGVGELIDATRTTNEDLRQAISGLRIGSILRVGLMATLKEYLQRFESQCGVATNLIIDPGAPSRFSPTIEVQVQSIIHEAFTNIRKHAQARDATVHFTHVDGTAEIVISDDGVGFDVVAEHSEHFGLSIMQERAHMIYAELRIESHAGDGTRLTIVLPGSIN